MTGVRSHSEWNKQAARFEATGSVPCPDCGLALPAGDDAARQAHYQSCPKGRRLSQAELLRLSELEVTIQRGLKVFYEVGTALLEVRDARLYRQTYGTFEEYCQQRWQLKRNYANKLISASEVITNLGTAVPIDELPTHEKHVRPLTALAPEEQQIVWQVVTDTAPGGKVTEAHVRSVVNVFKEVVTTGAIDDGTGVQIRVADAVKVAVTEETYERLKRQESHVAEKLAKKARVGATRIPPVITALPQDTRNMFDLWLACYSAQQIAERTGLALAEIERQCADFGRAGQVDNATIFDNFEPRIYSVWNFQKATNEVRHFGNIPPEIIDNLLYYYTQPFDVVFDPFAGGGSTIDKCRERQRRYYASDLTPIPERADIREWDMTAGLPDDLPAPDLVFLDPPYWKQAAGKYSDKTTDLANMPLDTFIGTIASLAQQIAQRFPGARLALIIGAYKVAGEYVDLPFLCYQAIQAHLRPIQRIQVPYSTQVHGGAFVNRAKEAKEILYLSRDLMIFGA